MCYNNIYMYFNEPFPLPTVTRYSAVAGVISGSDMSGIFMKLFVEL